MYLCVRLINVMLFKTSYIVIGMYFAYLDKIIWVDESDMKYVNKYPDSISQYNFPIPYHQT